MQFIEPSGQGCTLTIVRGRTVWKDMSVFHNQKAAILFHTSFPMQDLFAYMLVFHDFFNLIWDTPPPPPAPPSHF